MRIFTWILLAALCSCNLICAQSYAMKAGPASKVERQPEKMRLADVLQQFKDHYKVDILYADGLVKDLQILSSDVYLKDKLEKNLKRILRNTKLEYVKQKSGTILIVPAARVNIQKSSPNVLIPDSVETTNLEPSDVKVLVAEQSSLLKSISGTVKDENQMELPGVSVLVKGTQNGSITDSKGRFTIPDINKEDQTLIFSFVGFITQEVRIGNRSSFDVILKVDNKALEEVVVVGYGSQKKASLTAAVSTLDAAKISKQPVADMSSALGGRLAGVLYTQGSGQAGNDSPRIFIRGVSSTGNTNPLVVVDGIPRNFSQLNPNEVETITVLKDAAAVAPYGIGGANGVILVTTKRGKVGKPLLSFDTYYGTQTPTVLPKQVDAMQYLTMKNVAALNEGKPAPYSDALIEKYRNQEEPDRYPNTNILRDVMDHYAPMSSANLGVSGGSDKVRYNINMGHFYQKGQMPSQSFTRFNLSSNITAQATKTTEVLLQLNGRLENRKMAGTGFSEQAMFEGMIGATALTPFLFSNGLPTGMYAGIYNSPSYQTLNGKTLLTQMSIRQELPFIKGLSVKLAGAYDFNPFDGLDPKNNQGRVSTYLKVWGQGTDSYAVDTTKHPLEYVKITPSGKPSLSQYWNETIATTLQGYLEYANQFGNHDLSALLVLENRRIRAQGFYAGRVNYETNIQELFAGSSNTADLRNDGGSSESKQRSLVYRLHYGFRNKYIVEAAGRYDGHYYFAPGKRFGFFPSFSAAWRLSEENFMKGKVANIITDAKIRASVGESGGLAGGPFQYQSAFGIYGNSAILGGVLTQGLEEKTEANPNITWERARKLDIGVDLDLFQRKLSFSGDYFFEKRLGMLFAPQVSVPAEYGIGLSQVNSAEMENKGFEFSLTYSTRLNKDLDFSVNANFTYAQNKLTQVFENDDTKKFDNLRKTGRPKDTPFGLKALGYFTAADFNGDGSLKEGIASQTFTSKLYPGDIRYADISGPDHKPDGIIDYRDQVVMGAPGSSPGIVYGVTPSLTYKGFELSLTFQGAGKRSTQIAFDAAWPFFNGKNALTSHTDYWTPENTDAPNPRLTSVPSPNNTQTSTFWQRDLSYLRLRTGLLGYNLPATVLSKLRMSSCKIYLSGSNLLTFTSFENFDPEMVQGRGWYYPSMKSYTVGLSIGF